MDSVVAACGLQSTNSVVVAPWGVVAPWRVESSRTRDEPHVLCIGRRVLYHWTTREVTVQHLKH